MGICIQKEVLYGWFKAVIYVHFHGETVDKVGNGLSVEFEVRIGVPQGSVLSL